MVKKPSSTNLFLLEMVMMLLVFALCMAMTVKMFAVAHNEIVDSRDLSNAVVQCQNVAEIYQSAQGDLGVLVALLGGSQQGQTYSLAFDEQWQVAAVGQYLLTVNVHDLTAEIQVVKQQDPTEKYLYGFRVKAVQYEN